MTENNRLIKLFNDLLDGEPWLDETLIGTLSKIPATTAGYKIGDGWNSVWEITNHIIDWRSTVLQRVNGMIIPTPDHNFFLPVNDQSDEAWQSTLQKLKLSQKGWINYLETVDTADFDIIYPVNGKSNYDHILGINQHDAYHLGQIRLLLKLIDQKKI